MATDSDTEGPRETGPGTTTIGNAAPPPPSENLSEGPRSSGGSWRSIVPVALALLIGALGVVMTHRPMLSSGFRRIQTNLGDSRFNHYILEHGYRWLRDDPAHQEFWSPPFYYPATNAAAYSDVLLTVGPVYWLWRALGASPDLSFALWMVSMSVLNYAAGLLLFRRGLGFGMPATVAAAALVAFGAPRVNQLGHQQMLPCFFTLLSLYALSRLFRDRSLGPWARTGYWLLAVSGAAAQLYSGVYLGWFMIVGLGTATLAALCLRSCRPFVLELIARDQWPIVAAGAVGLILMLPFLSHYLEATREVPPQYLLTLRMFHPKISDWFDLGKANWLWGWMSGRWPFSDQAFGDEHHLGIGFLTLLACAAGFYVSRERPICRLAITATGLLWFVTTFWPSDIFVRIAAGVCGFCIAGLFYERGEPAWRGIGLLVMLGLLLLIRFPNPYIEVLGSATVVLCLLEIARLREHPLGWIIPALAIGAIGLKLLPLWVVAISTMLVAPIAGLVAYYYRTRWFEVGLASVALVLVFAFVLTFVDRPDLLTGVPATALLWLAVTAPRRLRPPAWLLVRAMLCAVPFLTLFYHQDSLWLGYSSMIPGANAIRAVGRIVLILLVPAALGLAYLVESLDRRGWAALGWLVALVCLAEQGVTTDTFDAAANRAAIAQLAGRIDRSRTAFYYHPCDYQRFWRYQLDAMWASMDTGQPTINGYSGYYPRDWTGFFTIDFEPIREVRDVLIEWLDSRKLSPDHIQWIGADCPLRHPPQSAESPEGSVPLRGAGTIP
jgi:hypothetical protein